MPGGYEIILNTGEFDADAALAVRRAGGSGVYHTIRVREGRDTAFDPDVREATMLAAVRAGLRLVALVEPVGRNTRVRNWRTVFCGSWPRARAFPALWPECPCRARPWATSRP